MIAIISGSSRKNNNTIKVAKAIQNLANKYSIKNQLVNFEQYDLPFFNGVEINWKNLSTFQQNLSDAMLNAKLIIMISPEYNWYPSAEIINFINHFGTKENELLWNNKTFAFVGVSSGRAGRLPAIHMQTMVGKIMNVLNFHSIISSKIYESQETHNVLDESGNSLGIEKYDKGLLDFFDYNLKISNIINK